MLLEMLKKNSQFQALPLTEQEILARLASTFEEDFRYLYLSPDELAEETEVGNRRQWQQLLHLDITNAYIRQQMSSQLQVAQRKAIQALQVESMRGNTQAAKQITDLSNILNQQDSSKIIILHQVQRPKTQPQQ
jgi:chromosome condensin MukBEF MukE localization factor